MNIEATNLVVIVMAALTLFLLTGRGGYLLLGGKADQAKREQYDEKKLSRVFALGTGVVTLELLALSLWREQMSIWGFYLFAAVTIGVLALVGKLVNTVCRKK